MTTQWRPTRYLDSVLAIGVAVDARQLAQRKCAAIDGRGARNIHPLAIDKFLDRGLPRSKELLKAVNDLRDFLTSSARSMPFEIVCVHRSTDRAQKVYFERIPGNYTPKSRKALSR